MDIIEEANKIGDRMSKEIKAIGDSIMDNLYCEEPDEDMETYEGSEEPEEDEEPEEQDDEEPYQGEEVSNNEY